MQNLVQKQAALGRGESCLSRLPILRSETRRRKGLEGALRLSGQNAGTAEDRTGREGNSAGIFKRNSDRCWQAGVRKTRQRVVAAGRRIALQALTGAYRRRRSAVHNRNGSPAPMRANGVSWQRPHPNPACEGACGIPRPRCTGRGSRRMRSAARWPGIFTRAEKPNRIGREARDSAGPAIKIGASLRFGRKECFLHRAIERC